MASSLKSSESENKIAKVIGEGVLLASIQVALGSVEMSSRFSVLNFSKDQETLQNAANALSAYIVIGTIWAVGTILIMWSSYGITGLLSALFCNLLIMTWISVSYVYAFKRSALKYGLEEPKMFKSII